MSTQTYDHAPSIRLALQAYAYAHNISVDVEVKPRRGAGSFTAKFRRSGEKFWYKTQLWVSPARRIEMDDLTFVFLNMKLVLL